MQRACSVESWTGKNIDLARRDYQKCNCSNLHNKSQFSLQHCNGISDKSVELCPATFHTDVFERHQIFQITVLQRENGHCYPSHYKEQWIFFLDRFIIFFHPHGNY